MIDETRQRWKSNIAESHFVSSRHKLLCVIKYKNKCFKRTRAKALGLNYKGRGSNLILYLIRGLGSRRKGLSEMRIKGCQENYSWNCEYYLFEVCFNGFGLRIFKEVKDLASIECQWLSDTLLPQSALKIPAQNINFNVTFSLQWEGADP